MEVVARAESLVAWRRGSFWQPAGNLTTGLLPGHTYDRSIMVDGEEASLMVYDIWEQVGRRLRARAGLG